MAKDPAVLLYTSDFLSSTFTMSNEQVGMFIRLLCYQHQQGSLSENDMMNICKTYDEKVWSKFDNTDAGYINLRMYEESEKRKKYSESRRNNKLSTTKKEDMSNISSTYVNHMENENENEVVIRNKIQKGKGFVKPELFQVQNYFEEVGALPEAEGFFNYYESNGWKVGKNPMKDWQAASRNWIKNSKNYKHNGTSTKSNFDIYNEKRNELHNYFSEIDRQRGIGPGKV